MPVMKRRRKNKTGQGAQSRHTEPREAFHLPVELQLALEFSAATAEPPAGKSAVVRFALEKYLAQKGSYPLSEEQLQQLLKLQDVAELSTQAQAYLREKGLLPAEE